MHVGILIIYSSLASLIGIVSGLTDQHLGWEPSYPRPIHKAVKVARHYAAMHI